MPFFKPNNEHLKILKQGVDVWNKWREENPEQFPYFNEANLSGLKLRKANLSHAAFQWANLNKADLIGANFRGADFLWAKLIKAKLDGANFTDADLTGANLSKASCLGINFNGADMSDVVLTYANLREAKLQNAYLNESDLQGADLSYAKLNDAILTGSNLIDTCFNGTELANADFSGAYMAGATFAATDLSLVKGLDSVRHYAPSTIGIDTLYISEGKIPTSFLKGCGLPEEFITQIPALALAAEAIQFYSCFISYSSKDEEFAKRLYSRMRDEGLRVWYAPEDIKGGEKLHEQIFRAIQLHDRLLVVLSENSLQSEWVMTEIRRARKTEIEENRRKLFPIRLVDFETLQKWECFDADSGKDLAIEVREYFIPDFSDLKDHDSFENSFDRLLRDLRASG